MGHSDLDGILATPGKPVGYAGVEFLRIRAPEYNPKAPAKKPVMYCWVPPQEYREQREELRIWSPEDRQAEWEHYQRWKKEQEHSKDSYDDGIIVIKNT
jgi:hypothetical protein